MRLNDCESASGYWLRVTYDNNPTISFDVRGLAAIEANGRS